MKTKKCKKVKRKRIENNNCKDKDSVNRNMK